MIHNLQDIIEQRCWSGDVAAVVHSIEARLCRQMNLGKAETVASQIRFTRLQSSVFNHADFFRTEENNRFTGKHLIVQGATSAGKTLVSEIAVLDTLRCNKKALVLVPLKSMVRERYTRFRDDFSASRNYRVYASSGDYLDYDEELLKGKYDVAVMVYEKLFAMLCRPGCSILDDCGLIVVDELSMLEVEARGPKLEIAIQKAKSVKNPPRILCLATTDCDPRYIRKWLSTNGTDDYGDPVLSPAATIIETSRPVGLNEYIVYKDGGYQMRGIPGEQESSADRTVTKGKFPVSYNPHLKESEQKKNMLRAVLNHLYNPSAAVKPKTLVFVPSQNGVRQIAEYIADKLELDLQDMLPAEPAARAKELARRKALAENFRERLNCCDTDEYLDILQEKLLAKGVAFHHGSMSTNLRETLEEQFAQDPSLKIIVATETLTIGVNLPIDAVILYDTSVPDGSGNNKRLTLQQYRNYIGRAGRLGLAQQRGESYLLAVDRDEAYWEPREDDIRPITSALADLDENHLTPYYLNLLVQEQSSTFVADDIQQIHKSSLSYLCGAKKLNGDKLIKNLTQMQLAHSLDEDDHIPASFGSAPVFEEQFVLNQYGKSFAPYAFYLPTTSALINSFVRGLPPYYRKNSYPYGFTANVCAADIVSDRYLLDILFTVCMTGELSQSSTLNLSVDGNPEKNLTNRKQLCRELKKLVMPAAPDAPQPLYHCDMWEGSYLRSFFCGPEPEQNMDYYKPLFRTLLIFYWVKGHSAKEIRKLTGIDCGKYSNGDLERCAETISFLLDAVYQIVAFRQDSREEEEIDPMTGAVLNLSKRVKYGIPSDLIIFANRHVHGLDRSRIIAFGKAARAAGCTPLDYLRTAPDHILRPFFTPQQRTTLLQRLQSRFKGKLEDLTKKLQELSVLQSWKNKLENLSQYALDADGFFDLLGDLLNSKVLENGRRIFHDCRDLEKIPGHPDSRCWDFIDRKGETRTLYITYACTDKESQTVGTSENPLHLPGGINDERLNLLVLNGTQNVTERIKEVNFTGFCSLCLNCENLAALLASSILLGGEENQPSKNGIDLLYEILNDARGCIDNLSYGWLNYDTPHSAADNAEYQILMDQDAGVMDTELKKLLEHDSGGLKHFCILPWGDALEKGNFTGLPTVILLNRSSISHRHSLTAFLDRMKQDNLFHNCLVLVHDDNDVAQWTAADPEKDGMPWIDGGGICNVKWYATAEERRDAIRLFLAQRRAKDFMIAVSYPHYDEHKQILKSMEQTFVSQNGAMQNLITRLNMEYGSDLILWDANDKAQQLFHGDPETALQSYGKCRLGLVLYNRWGWDNYWCRQERARMKENGVQILYLGPSYLHEEHKKEFILEKLPENAAERDALIKVINSKMTDILSANNES